MARITAETLEFTREGKPGSILLVNTSDSRSVEDLIPLANFLSSIYGGEHLYWLHHHKGCLFAGISPYAPIQLGKAIIDCWNYVDGGSTVEVYDASEQSPILGNEVYPDEKAIFRC
jgi:hypothetical protein